MVPYMDAVVVVTVMRVLLFVLHVCMLRECEGVMVTGNASVGDGLGVAVVGAGHVGGTRGSGNVSSTADVLWMSVVRGMRGVGGVCEMCMWLAHGAWVQREVSGSVDCVWSLPILWEQGEC